MVSTDDSKKKLVFGIIFFILTCVAFGMTIYYSRQKSPLEEKELKALMVKGISFLVAAFIFACLAHCFIKRYRRSTNHPGAISTIIYALTFIPFWSTAGMVLMIPHFILGMVDGFRDSKNHEWRGAETIKAEDKDGNEYKLTQSYTGSSSYKDEDGGWWTTKDGDTFRRS